jgi:hypothetical protein
VVRISGARGFYRDRNGMNVFSELDRPVLFRHGMGANLKLRLDQGKQIAPKPEKPKPRPQSGRLIKEHIYHLTPSAVVSVPIIQKIIPCSRSTPSVVFKELVESGHLIKSENGRLSKSGIYRVADKYLRTDKPAP